MLFVLLVAGMVYIAAGVEETRAAGMAALMMEYAAWIALLGVAMARSPQGVLRVSDPYLMLLGLGFNFLVYPSIIWLHGADMERQWYEFGRIRMDIFVQLQGLHVMFMVALSALYFAIAPRHRFRFEARDADAPLPDGRPWIVIGLLPVIYAAAQRLITTGTLAATKTYGEAWTTDYAEISAVHAEGGSALVAAQFVGKVWFLPWLALGIGEGLLLAKLLRDRRRLPLVLFALQAPVLLFLNSGGRSVIAAPFLIAVLVADVLVGPIKWRWVLSIGAVAMVGLNFFGIYRAYRDRDFGEAFALANEEFGNVSRSEAVSAEGPIMLVKEHFSIGRQQLHPRPVVLHRVDPRPAAPADGPRQAPLHEHHELPVEGVPGARGGHRRRRRRGHHRGRLHDRPRARGDRPGRGAGRDRRSDQPRAELERPS